MYLMPMHACYHLEFVTDSQKPWEKPSFASVSWRIKGATGEDPSRENLGHAGRRVIRASSEGSHNSSSVNIPIVFIGYRFFSIWIQYNCT